MDFLNGNNWVRYSNRCTRNVFSPVLSITYTKVSASKNYIFPTQYICAYRMIPTINKNSFTV